MVSSASGLRKRIALFTPLPPAHTGTADYAAALIPELRKHADVEVHDKAPRSFDPGRYDAVIYQIANNPWHAWIYETALKFPGIVVLHEANLHDLIRGMTAHRPEAYLNEVAYEMFGQELKSMSSVDLSSIGQQTRTFSMMRRLLDRSLACIVHSQFVSSEVRRKGFRGRVCRIPHGAGTATHEGADYRARLGIRNGEKLIGLFGYQRPDRRALECLAAFRGLLETAPSCRMVIAGAPHPEVPLESRIKELGLQEKVQVLGFQDLDDLDGYISACDVVLNLRWPTFGETSGIAVRAFALGKTVVVSDSGSDREWPDDICVRIPCDQHEEETLAETLRWLVANPEAVCEIGSSAGRFIRENCTWDNTARKYADFVASYQEPCQMPTDEVADRAFTRRYLARWAQAGSAAERYQEEHESRLIRTLQLTPAGSQRDRVLEMGCYLQITPGLRDLAGYGEVRGCYLGTGGTNVKGVRSRDGDFFECTIDLFDCERDPFPYPNDHFSTVLCCELLEHLSRDPMRALSEIHRILKSQGTLVLTTPNIVSLRAVSAILQGSHPGFYCRYPDPDRPGRSDSKHEREYTPVEVSQLLMAAGFVVDHIETGPYSAGSLPDSNSAKQALTAAGQSTALRGDCIFALGRKAQLPREFRPTWLYDSSPDERENS